MLKHLYIKNFTLIDELDIAFNSGFSVITGETGAGKSIILGAIALLLGQRADSKAIKQGAEKCVIEAEFDLSKYSMEDFFTENDIEFDHTECIIRRELTATGKSRAFINDTPVQLSMLKELGERLVDVHSQHQNLLLNKQDFQLSVVDILADDNKELSQYQSTFAQYHATQKALTALEEEIERNRQNSDFLKFQFDELTNAHLEMEKQAKQTKDSQKQLFEQTTQILNQANQNALMLYSQKDGYIFDLAYACHEATEQFNKFKTQSKPFQKILRKNNIEVARYDSLINYLQKMPKQFLDERSQINRNVCLTLAVNIRRQLKETEEQLQQDQR